MQCGGMDMGMGMGRAGREGRDEFPFLFSGKDLFVVGRVACSKPKITK